MHAAHVTPTRRSDRGLHRRLAVARICAIPRTRPRSHQTLPLLRGVCVAKQRDVVLKLDSSSAPLLRNDKNDALVACHFNSTQHNCHSDRAQRPRNLCSRADPPCEPTDVVPTTRRLRSQIARCRESNKFLIRACGMTERFFLKCVLQESSDLSTWPCTSVSR